MRGQTQHATTQPQSPWYLRVPCLRRGPVGLGKRNDLTGYQTPGKYFRLVKNTTALAGKNLLRADIHSHQLGRKKACSYDDTSREPIYPMLGICKLYKLIITRSTGLEHAHKLRKSARHSSTPGRRKRCLLESDESRSARCNLDYRGA